MSAAAQQNGPGSSEQESSQPTSGISRAVVSIIVFCAFIFIYNVISKPGIKEYKMPGELDFKNDTNLHRVLENGLQIKVKSSKAKLLAHDMKTPIDTLKPGELVFHDNAQRRFRKRPYIFVSIINGNISGWIHVKDLGYRKQ